MKKFTYFSRESINEILKNRQLQTSEYDISKTFVDSLIRNDDACLRIGEIVIVSESGGSFCLKRNQVNKIGIVIDLEKLNELNSKGIKDKILIIQKILRFCVKYWYGHPMTSSERKIPDTSKYCLLPLPFSSTNYYKILIDSKPDEVRQKKRNLEVLLAFNDGYNEPSADNESLTNLRKAITNIDKAIEKTKNIENSNNYDYNNFDNPVTKTDTIIKGYIGFEKWENYLTTTQKKFIYNISLASTRIEGPAGTGKTLSLVLRTIYLLKSFKDKKEPFHIIFFTHSTATKNSIINFLSYDLENNYFKKESSNQSVTVTTLLEWCIKNGNTRINLEDCIEPDAQDSKQMQLLYIEEIYKKIMEKEYESTYMDLLSKELVEYFHITHDFLIFESLQREFAIFIKGQANQDFEAYKNLEKSALPVKNDVDKGFIFRLFHEYQKQIEEIGQFDIDDVVLTSMGSLNTPIWKRIRNTQGYDYIILDETQLFNFNELSLLQYVNKEQSKSNICFSQDVSQAVSDIGFNTNTLEKISTMTVENNNKYNLGTVFRCSPEIAEIAFKVLSSGPTLLTNLKNPLENIEIVANDNGKFLMPKYKEFTSDNEMVKYAYSHVDKIVRENKLKKSDVLIVTTNSSLLQLLESEGRKLNKPIKFIEKRGDTSIAESVKSSGMYVGSMIEFVGGLEFEAVVILGVDSERVPPMNEKATHFQKHAWVNKLYIAITRARIILEIYGNNTFAKSSLISSSINCGVLLEDNNN